MNSKDFYTALVNRYNKRFDQYEELVDIINTMTDNLNIIKAHNKKTPNEYINFSERTQNPTYNKKRADSTITDVIILIATLESKIVKLVNHKNLLVKELTGTQ